MSNKNKLGITDGEWKLKKGKTIEGVYSENQLVCALSVVNLQDNAKLIADAGTTANKCGKLFSEVLKDRNELLEKLKDMVFAYESNKRIVTDSDFLEAKELIELIEK